jgi:acyl-CoA dehydrogenase
MNEIAESLREAAAELFKRELKSPGGEFSEALWLSLESVELPLVGIPESAGGAGGGLAEAAAIARTTGYFAVPAPLVETAMLAGRVLAESGFEARNGPLALVTEGARLTRDGAGWRLEGGATRVPWARLASTLVVLGEGFVVVLPRGEAEVIPGANLGGEPRDDVAFRGIPVPAEAVHDAPAGLDQEAVLGWGALARAAQITGALERILEMTVQYAIDRQQFGRPISRFQALQHGAATVAGEVAAALAAVEAAVERPETMSIAIAKLTASAAVGPATRFAHQVHGALGFTDEHPLYHFTTRLWAWRDEFGSEEEWAMRIGRHAAGAGDRVWEELA